MVAGFFGHGISLYRREVHAPLLVISPSGSPTAKIVNEPVSNREIPATVAEWVDLGPRDLFPGRPLTRFLDNGTEQLPETSLVLSEAQHIETVTPRAHLPSTVGPVRSAVSRDRVYIRGDCGREELYDLFNDPLESVNLARHPQSRRVIDWCREEFNQLGRGVNTLAH